MIELRDISRSFGEGENQTHALRGVSLDILEGEFVAIMGASGSGKSTLLHILGLLDNPTSGTYRLMNQHVVNLDEDQRAYLRNSLLGFVFQSFHLLSRTNVFEQVQLPLMYSTVPAREWRDRAMRVIELVGMGHRLGHVPSQLSGGEKQRVAIARALVLNPKVLFADEPTGNLDSKNSENVMEVFTQLHQDLKQTIVMITHEDDIAGYAQRTVRMQDGLIVSDNL